MGVESQDGEEANQVQLVKHNIDIRDTTVIAKLIIDLHNAFLCSVRLLSRSVCSIEQQSTGFACEHDDHCYVRGSPSANNTLDPQNKLNTISLSVSKTPNRYPKLL